jgi:hypothetical protein
MLMMCQCQFCVFHSQHHKALPAQEHHQYQINQAEALANQDAQSTIGMQTTCKFAQEDLTAMLNRWKLGTFSSTDYDVAECEDF